ncbi:basic amino acid ABC transporter substrate-binding protein [Bacillus sp. FJAT-49732]|uniref:Basic amino acid ABC transporter substrate-binding protein n=1 Tax=Lederbergia citrisecunda TaxID=2833583 RepID=A0A942YJL5_9BACI|nr:basic amino acid ABC transporter substrate-binding protein [Lederbergia citrisecunda]MBS4198722.1 basic amino acid ABC transporter substrate-binding protein [Lederbergia citrisecunda]
MKISFKKSLFALAASSALLLAACGTSQNDSNKNGSNDNQKKVLHVGTEATFPPFELVDKGELTGFDVELLKALGEEAGYGIDIKNTGWDSMLAGLDSKDLDIGMSGITIKKDRLDSYDFSIPYYESEGFLILFKDNVDIKNAEDLKNLKVGVQNGTTGAEAAESVVGKNAKNISKYESSGLMFQALLSGSVDAAVTDKPVAEEYIKQNPDSNIQSVEDKERFKPEYYGIAFQKGSPYKEDFDKALITLFDNGKYTEIYKKWFNEDPDLESLKNAKSYIESLK